MPSKQRAIQLLCFLDWGGQIRGAPLPASITPTLSVMFNLSEVGSVPTANLLLSARKQSWRAIRRCVQERSQDQPKNHQQNPAHAVDYRAVS